jgi:hypothetical protein
MPHFSFLLTGSFSWHLFVVFLWSDLHNLGPSLWLVHFAAYNPGYGFVRCLVVALFFLFICCLELLGTLSSTSFYLGLFFFSFWPRFLPQSTRESRSWGAYLILLVFIIISFLISYLYFKSCHDHVARLALFATSPAQLSHLPSSREYHLAVSLHALEQPVVSSSWMGATPVIIWPHLIFI